MARVPPPSRLARARRSGKSVSGVQTAAECQQVFNLMKQRKAFKWITYKIDQVRAGVPRRGGGRRGRQKRRTAKLRMRAAAHARPPASQRSHLRMTDA